MVLYVIFRAWFGFRIRDSAFDTPALCKGVKLLEEKNLLGRKIETCHRLKLPNHFCFGGNE